MRSVPVPFDELAQRLACYGSDDADSDLVRVTVLDAGDGRLIRERATPLEQLAPARAHGLDLAADERLIGLDRADEHFVLVMVAAPHLTDPVRQEPR